MKFVCKNKCFFNGRVYKVGEVLEASSANKHFEKETITKKPEVKEIEEPKTYSEINKANEKAEKEALEKREKQQKSKRPVKKKK